MTLIRLTLPLFLAITAIFANVATAQVRTKTSLNSDWKFFKDEAVDASKVNADDGRWQRINLPHTWNAEDTFDDEPGFYRGAGWYRRELQITRSLTGKRIFLYFEGANQVADVYMNGEKAGSHIGGYSAFSFDVTSFVKVGERNIVAVRIDNSFNEDIPPLTADFNFYGGIYRDVWLIATGDVHFTATDHASSGIRISTPEIANGSGAVSVEGTITNAGPTTRNIQVVSTVLDATNKKVAEAVSKITASADVQTKFRVSSLAVPSPKLWSPDTPYLYKIKNTIRENGKTIDLVVQPLGFRWFRFDGQTGFSLNGKPLKLRGTNRHQDLSGLGNAVPDRLHIRDMELIKAAGFNFVRLAHYPQDPSVLEACDRLGLIVWEETPLVNYITKSKAFNENSAVMVREMIRQHRNHPSVAMWGYMNEIFLRVPRGRTDLYPATVELARELNRIAKEEDPTRTTTIAFHGNEIYNTSGLGDIPDIIGWNLYQGWYSGDLNGFGKFIDEQHRRFPKRPLIISEYGANADRRLHSTEPRRFDSTIEYQRQFHESYLSQIEARPFLSGSAIWSQFDFGSEYRGESIPHLNQKGMYYFDRRPKDIHYLYKAALSNPPVLHIAVRDQKVFAGEREKQFMIDVYSNLPEIELMLNGKSLGRQSTNNAYKVSWKLSFKGGLNVLTARGTLAAASIEDRTQVTFQEVSVSSPQIAINVGSNADYIDSNGIVWLTDQAYRSGSWGFLGEKVSRTEGSQQDPNILLTNDDPLFQTALEGLVAYRIDVPNGTYTIELLFAETKLQDRGKRVFNVSINGRSVIKLLDLASSPGPQRPFKHQEVVMANNGILISFEPEIGSTLLSGIRIVRQ